jgi:hypothetical protein
LKAFINDHDDDTIVGIEIWYIKEALENEERIGLNIYPSSLVNFDLEEKRRWE